MSNHSDTIPRLLDQRMKMIGQLSQETARQLQLLQRLSGQQVLLMKESGITEASAARGVVEAQLEACQLRLDALEQDLAGIDTELAAATDKEEQDG